jgi:hypothetical protein
MSQLENQIELLRGQIEELQGKLEETFALRRGRGGLFGSLRGRSRRMRGKARQSYARAKMGMLGIRSVKLPGVSASPDIGQSSTKYALIAVGLSLVIVAVLWPGLLSRLWDQASGRPSAYSDPTNAAHTSAEL